MISLVGWPKLVKSRSGGCLERSGDRKPAVRMTVDTTVSPPQTPNVRNLASRFQTKVLHDMYHALWDCCIGGVIHKNSFCIFLIGFHHSKEQTLRQNNVLLKLQCHQTWSQRLGLELQLRYDAMLIYPTSSTQYRHRCQVLVHTLVMLNLFVTASGTARNQKLSNGHAGSD